MRPLFKPRPGGKYLLGLFVGATHKRNIKIQTVPPVCMSASLIGRFGSSALRLSHHSSVDVACGLVLLFGLGAKALPVWDSRMRGTIFGSALPSNAAGPSGHAISPHPSSRKGHHSTARWSSRFLLSIVILCCHAAAASCRLQRNSVPSTQIRCMITASRRASATIAFFLPRRLAICIAQALSQDHLTVRVSRICAAS